MFEVLPFEILECDAGKLSLPDFFYKCHTSPKGVRVHIFMKETLDEQRLT